MKPLKIFSVIATIIAILGSAVSYYNSQNKTKNYYNLNNHLNALREYSIQSPTDTSSEKEKVFKRVEALNNYSQAIHTEDDFTVQKFWIKVIFSGAFCIASLFVVLSNKYDPDVKKWAFSVLTLIAGVWIGTVSN